MYWRLFSVTLSSPVTRPFLSIVTSPPLSLSLAICAESLLGGVETVSEVCDGDASGFRSVPVFTCPLLFASRGPDFLLRAIIPANSARTRRTTVAMAYEGLVTKPRHQGAACTRF